ncbi:MAG: DUF1800 domain-containing protein [Chthoniobacterales bacterium]
MLDSLSASSWSLHHAAHLLNRAGFGGSPDEVQAFHAKGLETAVKSLIEGKDDDTLFPAPDWAKSRDMTETRTELVSLPEDQRKKIQQQLRMNGRDEMLALREWWMTRMRYTEWPLREKMALFWHGHFATSIEKVHETYWMYLQNQTFRTHGLGSFQGLVKWMTRDPAMIRWLDLQQSNLRHPNENFAREVMELFTLGEGHYTEKDIRESARAFTGYRFDPKTQQFAFAANQHDEGQKTFMSKTGNFDGDGIVDIIFEQPQCARFMAKKIWSFFAYENPPQDIVDILAEEFRAKNYNVGGFLSSIFQSSEFYSKTAYRTQIKSPAQWIVETSKTLETKIPDTLATENAMRQMGQVLFAPPNVKGWVGNRAWISTSTLFFRYNMAAYFVTERISKGQEMQGRIPIQLSMEKVAPAAIRNDEEALVSSLEFRLMNAPLPARERAAALIYAQRYHGDMTDARIRDLLLMMMSTPEFQLT